MKSVVACTLALWMALIRAAVAEVPVDTVTGPFRDAIEHAVNQVRPALVRIHVVETYYSEGRELKYEASGSGVVITSEGHVITNHHVAGHAKQLKCTFADKEEIEAELVGTDPLTDIAVIKLKNDDGRVFSTVSFGDSSRIKVGDHVLAMGSPLALSQSVTLGIVSNTEMIMPAWLSRGGGLELDGEDVGALVRWIGHDAEIHGGNSGGPLVDTSGKVIGINEIKMGLSGAIPGNLARHVAEALIREGRVRRAWIGIELQPRLKNSKATRGALISGTLKDGPAALAGIQSGDLLVSVNGAPVDVRFQEQLPDLNRTLSELPIGREVELGIERAGIERVVVLVPVEREPREPEQYEIKQWGLTVRNLSYLMAKELKRDTTEGVLVTSVRPGGPSGDAKPEVSDKDILVAVDGKRLKNVSELQALTAEITKDSKAPVPVLATFERKTAEFVTVVKVGIKELPDPGLEVKKAWLPVKTQVLTRDIAALMGGELSGFRITHVYAGSTAEKAGIQVGDIILKVDDEKLTASAPEHYEELSTLIRQYRVGDTATLHLRRGGENLALPVELERAPLLPREMKKYRDDRFEFTVRDIGFVDKADERWKEEQEGVLVDQVVSGGWAALGMLAPGDLILEVEGQTIGSSDALAATMKAIAEQKTKSVTFKVLRGIHTFYIELEPKWDNTK